MASQKSAAQRRHRIRLPLEFGPPPSTHKRRVRDVDFEIPAPSAHDRFAENNYKVGHLKAMCHRFSLHVTGNKDQLRRRIYSFMRLHGPTRLVQRAWRHSVLRRCARLRGSAAADRTRCCNSIDFLTMEPIDTVPHQHFISLHDASGKVYGFSVQSLAQLFATARHEGRGRPVNPFNRQEFLSGTGRRLRILLKLSLIVGHVLPQRGPEVPVEQAGPTTRARRLFGDMGEHGMIVQPEWFTELTQLQLVQMVRELYDIWSYRAHALDIHARRSICPPAGDPFAQLDRSGLPQRELDAVRGVALTAMERLSRTGITAAHRAMGVNYALCALVLVSPGAAGAYPWLYQAVASNE